MQMAMVVVVEWGEGGARSGLAVLLIHSEVPALIPKTSSMQGFRFHSLSKGCPIPLLPRVMVLPSDVLPVVMQGSSSKAGEQIR